MAICLLACSHAVSQTSPHELETEGQDQRPLFARENLVAWCIVPFDGKKRGPAERAAMLKRLGLRRVAYDWRNEHVPTFEEEILQYKKHGIEYFAFWGVHDEAFRLFEKHGLHPQIWQTLGSPAADSQDARVAAAARQLLPLVQRTGKRACQLGLYNHGGWGGEPENLVAVCEYLRKHHDAAHVGIVYNLHHGHGHIDDFESSLALMKPYLLCLNLNGMTTGGDRNDRKILPLGEGEHDVKLLRCIRDSGYQGPIGLIGHTQDDVELRLRDNLNGLDWILPQLDGKPAGPKPAPRTWSAKNDVLPAAASDPYSPEIVARFVDQALTLGDARRGLMAFASAQSACLSCHRIGRHGGRVGPDLTAIGEKRKPKEIVESVVWPNRHVEAEFAACQIVTDDGRSRRGYIVREDQRHLVLRDPSKEVEADETIPLNEIEMRGQVGSLMPGNLIATMTPDQQRNLFRFLFGLGREDGLSEDEITPLLLHATAHANGPASFPYDRQPLHEEHWPSWQEHVNRDRLYDFYAKQADHFRRQPQVPPVLIEYPGLDGGTRGHWGNQDEETWASDGWNAATLGSVHSGVFRGAGVTVRRGVCLRLGAKGELSACFNPETLTYDAVWTGGFVRFSSVRHGFMHGAMLEGHALARPTGRRPDQPFTYHGYYRHGRRVVFSYRLGDVEFLDAPWVEQGRFSRVVAPADEHPLRHLLADAPTQWPQLMETQIQLGKASPYAVDTIELPVDNPWNALLFLGGHDFLPDGSALVCSMQGDVWHVSQFAYPSRRAVWRRFAAGLHHPQGLVVDEDGIFVLGRDQITRLHDLNGDGEADFYECFSNAYQTSPAGHDFICGLERDERGNFYTASGNQGLLRISRDGRRADVIASGFRNPDGLGILPDGSVTVPCSEGSWTPASMVCAVRPAPADSGDIEPPFFGHGGPRNGQPPQLPLAYLPRGLDNSSGGQTIVNSQRWGPLAGQLLHFSFGTGSHFLLLRDEVDGQLQGAIVPLAGEFRSGSHRGRFSPADGQLYVSGMQGWGTYTTDDGCFQRVRYTQSPVHLPIGFHVHENGVRIDFSSPVDGQVAAVAGNHFAQCWNYRYSSGYGSPEFSTRHLGMRGHDVVAIAAAHPLHDGKSLFLEIPDLQAVNQLHLHVQSSAGRFHDLFVTVHRMDRPLTRLPGYRPTNKTIHPHPILADLARATRSVPNPHRDPLRGARPIEIRTGTNLSYLTGSFRVRMGEAIALTLSNPDVVPHNWALVKPGSLQRVGQLSNQLISDPDAALRQYVPETSDVLAYTDVVPPREKFTIYFHAPEKAGRYPYLCTFPGHWLVMNGEMIVE